MSSNANRAREYVMDTIQCGLVPFLKGAPGIGKSSIIMSIAKEYDMDVIDMRLSQADPTDMNGFPQIVNGTATYAQFDTFPLETWDLPLKDGVTQKDVDDAIASGMSEEDATEAFYKSGWILFLDEFNSAPLAIQAAAYKLVLDKAVGQHKLHPNVAIVCAGNREEDNAIVNTISTAMQSRVVHIPMHSDAEIWDKWAIDTNISHKIRDFIKYKPELINNFNPEQTEETFGCERTWEFADKFLKLWGDKIPDDKIALLQGTIGSGLANEFRTYIKVYKEIPDITEIATNPMSAVVPNEPDRKFAITGVIGAYTDKTNIAAVMQYVQRMNLEFQVIALQDVIKRDPSIAQDPAMSSWVQANMNKLF